VSASQILPSWSSASPNEADEAAFGYGEMVFDVSSCRRGEQRSYISESHTDPFEKSRTIWIIHCSSLEVCDL
jgi:hypothetical protein